MTKIIYLNQRSARSLCGGCRVRKWCAGETFLSCRFWFGAIMERMKQHDQIYFYNGRPLFGMTRTYKLIHYGKVQD